MEPLTTQFGYMKVLTLPGFVTKKVKMSREAQQFTFSSNTDLDFLQKLIGAMVVFGTGGPRPRLSESNGIWISVGTQINVVNPGDKVFPTQRIVVGFDGIILKVSCTYIKVLLPQSCSITGG